MKKNLVTLVLCSFAFGLGFGLNNVAFSNAPALKIAYVNVPKLLAASKTLKAAEQTRVKQTQEMLKWYDTASADIQKQSTKAGKESLIRKYEDQLTSSTGTWRLLDDEDTYFILDGAKNVMSLTYVEDGTTKYNGTYSVIHRAKADALSPLTFLIKRSDKIKEDWLECYVDDFEENFTQFTIMRIEEDLGNTGGFVYTHIYRISELPYKLGTYLLDGNEYKEESNNYLDANNYCIPNGTYTLETGETFTVLWSKPHTYTLFQYKNKDVCVEGSFNIAQDKKTIYLYIENDPYSKVKKQDKDRYDTTFSIYYPPDFYLYGDFNVENNSITINGLYHHTYSPTTIEDSTWVFGTYVK